VIPILATKYRVVAPDIPAFGFTKVPAERNYQYTFDSFAQTITAFLDVLEIKEFAVYIFDYGAPIALRIALERPSAVKAIVSQNGNAYVDGFGMDAWAPIMQLWKTNSTEDREKVRSIMLTPEMTKWQYEFGTPAEKLGQIAPETYTLDWALMSTKEQQDIQLDIFYNYQTNVPLYEKFQEYFRTSNVPILATWGKNDILFIAPGAEAYKKDSANVVVDNVDGGHFALETHTAEIAEKILKFFANHGF
jgi:pimeloyl-ACP methyl ester carboxylesterase